MIEYITARLKIPVIFPGKAQNAPVIIKCTETHMSRLCIFLFISTP